MRVPFDNDAPRVTSPHLHPRVTTARIGLTTPPDYQLRWDRCRPNRLSSSAAPR
jgi:hypothetical protein